MSSETITRPPNGWTVLREQMRQVGRVLRPETLGLAAIMALVTVVGVWCALAYKETLPFPWDATLLIALASLMLPFSVWRGERIFADAQIWTLPLERQKHALIKVAAGGLWLLVAVSAVVVWLMMMALVSGGMGEVQTRYLVTAAQAGLAAPAVRSFDWTPAAWQYAVPIGAAFVAYLVGSAVRLGLRYPLRWFAGLVLCFLFLAEIAHNGLFESAFEWLIFSPMGLDYALTGGVEHLQTEVRLADGQTVVAWTGLPTFGAWAMGLGAWIVFGVAGVTLAAARHREG